MNDIIRHPNLTRAAPGPTTANVAKTTEAETNAVDVRVSALSADLTTAYTNMESSVTEAFWEAQKDGLTMAESVELKSRLDRLMSAHTMVSNVMTKYHEAAMAIIKNMA